MFKSEQDIRHGHLDQWLQKNCADKLEKINPVEFKTVDTEFIDESHTYLLSNFIFRISCTGFIHSFFPHFDEHKVLTGIMNSGRTKKDPSYKYFGMTYQQIKEQWKTTREEACEKGTRMHAYIEYFYNDLHFTKYSPEQLGQEYVYFHKFHNDTKKKWKPFRTELNIWSMIYELIGQDDIIYQDIDAEPGCKELILGDHKRSKEIRFIGFAGKTGYGPVNDMQDCNFSHYSLQLNIYKYMIELHTDYKVKQMFLLIFSDTYEDYMMLEVLDMKQKVEKMLQYRLYNLIKQDIRHVNFFLRRVRHAIEENEDNPFNISNVSSNCSVELDFDVSSTTLSSSKQLNNIYKKINLTVSQQAQRSKISKLNLKHLTQRSKIARFNLKHLSTAPTTGEKIDKDIRVPNLDKDIKQTCNSYISLDPVEVHNDKKRKIETKNTNIDTIETKKRKTVKSCTKKQIDFMKISRPLKFYYDKETNLHSLSDYIIKNRNPLVTKIHHCKILYEQSPQSNDSELQYFDELKGYFSSRTLEDTLLFVENLDRIDEIWKKCESILENYLFHAIDKDVTIFCSGSINYLGLEKETESFVKKFYK